MKAISLWQPWASLWLSTAKVHETRHWPILHRGPLLVHAAKRPMDKRPAIALHGICEQKFGIHYRDTLTHGAIIGIVDVIDCVSTDEFLRADLIDRCCGDFRNGRFMWKRGQFVVFKEPIPYVGRQGFFNVPDGLLTELMS